MVEKDVNLSCVLHYDVDEPHFSMETLNGEDSQHWTKTMDSKLQSLQINMTWIHTPFSPNHKLVSSKWIFKVKCNVDGFVARHKPCLVARGFTQEGINFNETFFLVTQMESIQIVFVMTTIENLKVHQMDVKIVFLNGNLSKEIHMQQLEGLVVKGKNNMVCKFKKSLYGLI
jgi:hypothetical protein